MSSTTYGYIADTGPTQSYGNLPRKYNPVSPQIRVDFLVVAGGGAGGGLGSQVSDQGCGGGGAGGLRSSITNTGGGCSLEPKFLTEGESFTVTVGAGGTANVSGNDSVFSTITSIGGARGQTFGGHGVTGGSGGGGGGEDSGGPGNGGNGTSCQGYAGGAGRAAYASGSGGGGGGAGATGGAAVSDGGGTGGNGVTNTIISTSEASSASVGEVISSNVWFAGGGAGGHDPRGTSKVAKNGGDGGGANSQAGTASGLAGTANTGGGGSGPGSVSNGTGGAGGSGVVILRYPAVYNLSIGAGLTSTTTDESGGFKKTIFTQGEGTVSI